MATVFPVLPPDCLGKDNIVQAHHTITELSVRATAILHQEADSHQIKYHFDRIRTTVLPLLEALCDTPDGPSDAWLCEALDSIILLTSGLQQAYHDATSRPDTNVQQWNPITVVKTGKKGRPRKVIHPSFLRHVTNPAYKRNLEKICRTIGISSQHFRNECDSQGINHHKYSEISDDDLDVIVAAYVASKPSSGLRYLIGHLKTLGLRLSKQRLKDSISRVDPLSRTIRTYQNIPRGRYEVPHANSLWHVDGHHKLILWGIVIHGFVDGRTRAVTGLRASDNNRSLTVLGLLLHAIGDWGMPSRIRGDRGLENRLAALYIILKKGLNRGSFLFGSSTHNSRIERTWVEVGRQFVRLWRAFFQRLEKMHGLDRHNPYHLWLLHFLFLDEINGDCDTFQEEWNLHPIGGAGHDDSPLDMYLSDLIDGGVHVSEEDFDTTDPEILQESYGTDGKGKARAVGQTGAGYTDEDIDLEDAEERMDEDGSDDEAIDDLSGFPEQPEDAIEELSWKQLLLGLQDKFLPKPVRVPRKVCPFSGNDFEDVFLPLLAETEQQGHIPTGYGLLESEWREQGMEIYPNFEILRSGTRGAKELRIPLPSEDWLPRAHRWGMALHVMNTLMMYNEENE